MAALIRVGLRQSRNLGQYFSHNYLLKEARKVQGFVPNLKIARCLAALPDRKKHLLIDVHSKLDYNEGISTELFNSLMSSMEESGPLTEHDFALLLHICSFGPFDSSTSDRLEFADKIWSSLEKMSFQPTAKLYNMKLKVLCSNGKNFTPVEELTTMKSMGINPDKVTYNFLIEGFCQNGDVAGANHVLEAMNDAQFFIGISIFNSFITGHLKAGSPEEAVGVLETLKSRGLSTNTDTYYRFINHYAQQGDIESVLQYIGLAEKEGVPLDQPLLLKVYGTMLVAGKANEAKQILPVLSEKDVFRNTAKDNLCHLVAEGFHDEALNLYLNIPKAVSGSTPISAGSFLLKAMITNDRSSKDVMEVAEKLMEANPNTVPYRFALVYAYRLGKFDLAMALLETLISQTNEVRVPMILPAICHYRDNKNLEGVYKCVDMMLNLEPCDEMVAALQNFCFPALKKLNQSKEDIMTRMKEHERKWNTFFFLMELQTNGCSTALQSVAGKALNKEMLSWLDNNRKLLSQNLPEEKEPSVQLLTKLIKKENMSKLTAVGFIVNRLNVNDMETLNYLLDVFLQEKIRLPDRILQLKQMSEAPQDVQDRIKQLCDLQPISKGFSSLSMKELSEKSKEELEVYAKKFPNLTIPRIALLNRALNTKDLDDIHKRLREIEASGFNFPRYQLLSIVSKLIELGDVEAATKYFDDLQETYGESYPDTLPLDLAVRQIEQGNLEGALKSIEAAKEGQVHTVPGREFLRRSKVANLISKTKNMPDAEAVHQALVKGGSYLMAKDANVAHHHYILKALNNDDDKTLLERLDRLREQYWVFPCMDMVICRFIEKQDVESLKEVMDLGIGVTGSNLAHHKLACNFIACDMPLKAASIFQKLGERLSLRNLERKCQYFISKKQIQHVESLVEVVKNLPVSRAVMLKQLVEAYVSINDLTKATEVLHTYDSEFLVPHKSMLDSLVSALRKQGIEQPEILKTFLSKKEKVDQIKTQLQDSDSSSSSSSESDSDSDSDTDTEHTVTEQEGTSQTTPQKDSSPPTPPTDSTKTV